MQSSIIPSLVYMNSEHQYQGQQDNHCQVWFHFLTLICSKANSDYLTKQSPNIVPVLVGDEYILQLRQSHSRHSKKMSNRYHKAKYTKSDIDTYTQMNRYTVILCIKCINLLHLKTMIKYPVHVVPKQNKQKLT